MSKSLLIIGNSHHALRDYLVEHGYDYVTLKDARLTKFPDKKLKNRVVADFSDRQKLFETVDSVQKRLAIDGVMVIYESYVFIAAEIAAHLGVPAMPLEAARACTDKFLMRQKFADAPIKVSPDFALVESEQDVRDFAAKFGFPLILKPAHLAKSLLVTKSRSLEELLQNYERTAKNIDAVYAKYAPRVKPKLVIEEFLEGPVHSVDADSNATPHVLDGVVDYQTGYDIGYDDNFHYSRLLPSKLAQEDIERIREAATVGCQALGMKNSPAHVEIILTREGPRIVEIGARNGGYRERMYWLADGLDIIGNAVHIALGEPLAIESSKNEPVAVLELFPKTPGIFDGIANEAELRALPSLEYLSIKAKPGNFVGKSSDGYKMCAIVVLHHQDFEQFQKDLEFVNANVTVLTALAAT
jgi:biotin carboxylase